MSRPRHVRKGTRRLGSVYGTDWMSTTTAAINRKGGKRSNQHPPSILRYVISFRLKLEQVFEQYGEKVAISRPSRIALVCFLVLLAIVAGAGLSIAHIESDIARLWVEEGGRLELETKYMQQWKGVGNLRTTDVQQTCTGGMDVRTHDENIDAKTDTTDTGADTGADSTDTEILSEETSTGIGSIQTIIVTPSRSSSDMITTEILQEKYQLMIAIADMVICIDVRTSKSVECDSTGSSGNTVQRFNWIDNLCSKISPPKELQSFLPFVPCNRVTVLDCFKEGNFDWSQAQQAVLPGLLTADTKAGAILVNDYGVIGYGHLPSITANPKVLHQAVTGGCHGYATKISLFRWHESLIIGNPKKEAGETVKADALQSSFLLGTIEDIAERTGVSKGIAQVAVEEWKSRLEELTNDQNLDSSKRLYKQIKISVLLNNALADVLKDAASNNYHLTLIGIGVMFCFVVVSLIDFPCSNKHKCGLGQSCMGLFGICLVLLATVTAFGFTSWCQVSFNATSIQVLPFLALGLGVDDVFIVLSCWSRIDRSLYKDSVNGVEWKIKKIIGRLFSRAGPSITMTSLANFVAFLIGAIIPIPAVRSFCLQASAIVCFNYIFVIFGLCVGLTVLESSGSDAIDTNETVVSTDSDQDSHENFDIDFNCDSVIHKYADFILKPWVKIMVVVLFVGFLILSVRFIYEVKDGLDVDDIAPKGSPLQSFLKDKQTYFSSFDATIVTKDMNYPCKQQELLQFVLELKANPWVVHVEPSWLTLYHNYMKEQNRTDLLTGLVPMNDFYAGLFQWDKDVSASLDVLSAGKSNFGANKQGQLMMTQIKFTVDGLNSTAAYAEMIRSVRTVCANASTYGVHVFPEGVPFLFWEQYIGLRSNFWKGVGYIFIALIFITVPFVVNPLASLIIVAFVAMILLEVFGFMGLVGIKFSAVPAVSLLMSIGISVEFVAHFVLSFLMEFDGYQNARIRLTFLKMMPPVLQGGLSTFFSIVLLAMSQFEFVRKYFFLPFVSVCVIGLLNGLVLLPVVLSMVGPTAVQLCPSGFDFCCTTCARRTAGSKATGNGSNGSENNTSMEKKLAMGSKGSPTGSKTESKTKEVVLVVGNDEESVYF